MFMENKIKNGCLMGKYIKVIPASDLCKTNCGDKTVHESFFNKSSKFSKLSDSKKFSHYFCSIADSLSCLVFERALPLLKSISLFV